MSIRCGLVGLPNVGKSTLFNALTAMQAPAENYPFCTVDPNVGTVAVPDADLGRIAQVARPARVAPAVVEFVDVAGLVRGASCGEGLGNRFLARLREVDALIHVVRCFAGAGVAHVSGQVDPLADMDTVDTELLLADLETLTRAMDKAERRAKTNHAEAVAWLEQVRSVHAHVASGRAVRAIGSAAGPDIAPASGQSVAPGSGQGVASASGRGVGLASGRAGGLEALQLLTAKPILYAANVAESALADAAGSAHVETAKPALANVAGSAHVEAAGFAPTAVAEAEPVLARAAAEGVPGVVVCAAFEAALAQLPRQDRGAFLAEVGLSAPGLERLVGAAYGLLRLLTFYTVNDREARAWTVPEGATAGFAAGRVHTDFQRGFVRAEVIPVDTFVARGGEQGARETGEMRLEGRDYRVAAGDVIRFRFNV